MQNLGMEEKLGVTLAISIMVWCVSAVTDPSDASAIRTLYGSLNSPGQLTGWSSSGGDPCAESWKGVSCSGSRITEISIPGLGLSGSLGYSLTNLLSLKKLDVSNNNLAGSITYLLPYNVERLNLANNQFTQDIPYSISNLTSLVYLNLAHNQLQGAVGDMFQRLIGLSTIDLSDNQLSGNLPQSFSLLSSMNSMYLQNNRFTGSIDMLANLPLKNLNVENNQLTGWIPASLKKGVNLKTGGNNWNSGAAPPPPPGTPLPPPTHKSSNKNPPNTSKSSEKSKGISGGVIAVIIILSLVVVGVVVFLIIKKRSRKSPADIEKVDKQPLAQPASSDKQVHELKPFQSSLAVGKIIDTSAPITIKPPPMDRHKSFDEEDISSKPVVVKKLVKAPAHVKAFSIADLQIATSSFSIDHLLGEGSFGRVYRAHLDNGSKVVAVKKIDSTILPHDSSEQFVEMVSRISELRHPNVTELEGFCAEHGQHLLLYEFHKMGSLHDLLHIPDEQNKSLIWNTRVKIAIGTARALEYLHEVCVPLVVHKNVKSANILLDSELSPHLSDSCLASYLPNADQILNQDAGSGYTAPEVSMSGQYTLKSDVYSFGVVMLELLTGRSPFDSSKPRSEQFLVRWAAPQLHDIDALSKMVDPALQGLYPVKSLSGFADVIALCVQPEPEFRPPMSEVVEALVRLLQRANMSKRTVGGEQSTSPRENSNDSNDYL